MQRFVYFLRVFLVCLARILFVFNLNIYKQIVNFKCNSMRKGLS